MNWDWPSWESWWIPYLFGQAVGWFFLRHSSFLGMVVALVTIALLVVLVGWLYRRLRRAWAKDKGEL